MIRLIRNQEKESVLPLATRLLVVSEQVPWNHCLFALSCFVSYQYLPSLNRRYHRLRGSCFQFGVYSAEGRSAVLRIRPVIFQTNASPRSNCSVASMFCTNSVNPMTCTIGCKRATPGGVQPQLITFFLFHHFALALSNMLHSKAAIHPLQWSLKCLIPDTQVSTSWIKQVRLNMARNSATNLRKFVHIRESTGWQSPSWSSRLADNSHTWLLLKNVL